MKVNVLLNNPARTGEFADIELSFIAGNVTRNVKLYVSFQSLKDFSNDTTSVAFDFFLIASIVYGIDNLLDRYEFSVDGWARDIEVSLPVNNVTIWNDAEEDFESMLTFLTGDYWSVKFESINNVTLFEDRANRRKGSIPRYNLGDYTFSSLFSGGLDSLVGVIDGLNALPSNEKGLLISHFDSSSPGANADQKRIIGYLDRSIAFKNRFEWIQTIVALNNEDTRGRELNKESSFRSRSLLFIAISTFCVERMTNCNTLTIPENGVISLNFPLTPSRASTLSTRTTHPYFLFILQQLLLKLGMTAQLLNPYKHLTKGELVESCTDLLTLKESYMLSVSCGKRGRKMHWDTKEGTHHCGICMPCIYRRASLHAIGQDNQTYGIDIFTTRNSILDKYDFPALFNFLNSSSSDDDIRRTMMVSGTVPEEERIPAVDMIKRIKKELRQWIADKGNPALKSLAGI